MPAVEILAVGREGLIAAATHPDVDLVLCASSGTAGLEAALAAIDAGKTLALANKEVLVMAGALMVEAARKRGVAILPVDSEHNAIHQCLHGRAPADIQRLILTASGGPFRSSAARRSQRVTPEDALRHPTWRMGRKITIDSATLMNKGLEVIEARWLFDVPADDDRRRRAPAVDRPLDGGVLRRVGHRAARRHRHAAADPVRVLVSRPLATPLARLDVAQLGALEFAPPDPDRFPCLRLAYAALEQGGAWPVVLNAANEMAVEAFLAGGITFPMIPAGHRAGAGGGRSQHVAARVARRRPRRRRVGARVFGRNHQYATIVLG